MNSNIVKLLANSGLQSLICLMFTGLAGLGLWFLDTQVQVFSFGSSLFDAQFFPRIVLALIIVTSILCVIVRAHKADEPLGELAKWGRVTFLAAALVVSLWFMPSIGFLSGAFATACITALLLGERSVIVSIGLPLLVATLVTIGAQQGLTIPLP